MKNKKTKINRQNTRGSFPIILVSSFFALLFLSMSIYLCIYVKQNEQSLLNNSYNARQALLASENTRGTIFDRNGEVLASTKTVNGTEERNYPYDNLFSHVVGYCQKGKTGIESAANYYLINSNVALSQKVENDVSGKKNPGNNVYTTLDTGLQQIASDALGMYRGAVVVSEVKTGRILAMVSKPDFDPNTIVEDWDDYIAADADSSSKKSTVLLNRATQGLYPPGSTFKIITALEYIRENNDTTQYHFNCHGRFTYGNTTIQCYHGTNHGEINFLESFAQSCNSSFANMGVALNRDSYGETLKNLMFGEKLPFDYNYAISNVSVDSSVSDDDMIQISIGQGKAQITPLHLNMITNAIGNNGILMKPQLLSKAVSADGTTLKEYDIQEYKKLMSQSEADKLTELMVAVVNEGTAKKLISNDYQAAGKTGSAEYNGVKEDSHAWFTGFAPAEDPQISVTIIIESIGSGGDYAAPIAKRIFDGYFSE